jgi:two-component system nitrogen regulation sensor histidine kinase NtrY
MARLIAHDIKNPLTPIRLSAEHLREVWRRKDPDAGRILEECVANILKQAETLRATASEFADYARLPHAQRENVELPALIGGVVADFANAPRVDWKVEVPHASVRADSKLLARALANLVSNSLEGLGSGGGTISISAKLEKGRCVIRVADDGPGVSAEAFSRLFEPYFSSKSGGTGLGLSIVRKIAQEHGGDARAERLSPRGFAVEFDFDSGNAV